MIFNLFLPLLLCFNLFFINVPPSHQTSPSYVTILMRRVMELTGYINRGLHGVLAIVKFLFYKLFIKMIGVSRRSVDFGGTRKIVQNMALKMIFVVLCTWNLKFMKSLSNRSLRLCLAHSIIIKIEETKTLEISSKSAHHGRRYSTKFNVCRLSCVTFGTFRINLVAVVVVPCSSLYL